MAYGESNGHVIDDATWPVVRAFAEFAVRDCMPF